ncbi:MAG: hypothetical protein O2871_00270 [bacterium]|nr:hypothetical protein [bacterium]
MTDDLESKNCKKLAIKILESKNDKHPFSRCKQETYKVTNNGKSITRVYVVAGIVDKQWEFECGFMADCTTTVRWFDSEENLFDFLDLPDTVNHDPAVYTLGCGEINSSSIYDVEINPELVYENGKYWWKTEYNNTSTNTKNDSCIINGTSLVGYKEVLSNIKVKYLVDTENCSSDLHTPCRTAKALNTKSVEACNNDFTCISNYISQTGDTTLCGTEANFGKIDCERLFTINPL